MKGSKQRLVALLLALVLVALVGCGGQTGGGTGGGSGSGSGSGSQGSGGGQSGGSTAGQPVDGGTLRIALAKDLVTLDPTFAMDNYSNLIIDQIYDTLVTFDSDSKLTSRLATEWRATSDTEYEFTIRKGVKFHNGREMTADDVVWTINRMLDPATNVPRQHLFMVDKVEKISDDVVKFTLNQPYGPFYSILTNRALSIIPKEAVEQYGEDFARNPVGTGPFKFVSWTPAEGVTVERNADYFFGKPHLERVTFRAIPETAVAQQQLETGDIDVIADALPDDIERLVDAGLLQVTPGLSYYYALFNLHPDLAPIKETLGKNPFLDPKVREAVLLAFPFEDAIKAVYPTLADEIRAYGPIANSSWAYNADIKATWPKPDVARAKELLAEAGYPDGFETEILSMNDAARMAMAQILQNSLSQIGIKSSITAPDFGILLDRANSQTFDIAVFGWGQTPDPHDSVFPLLHTDRRGAGGNNSWYSNAEVDRLIDEAAVTADQAKREENYKKLQQIFVNDHVHLPLFYKPAILGVAPRVQELKVDPLSYFRLVNETTNVWIKP